MPRLPSRESVVDGGVLSKAAWSFECHACESSRLTIARWRRSQKLRGAFNATPVRRSGCFDSVMDLSKAAWSFQCHARQCRVARVVPRPGLSRAAWSFQCHAPYVGSDSAAAGYRALKSCVELSMPRHATVAVTRRPSLSSAQELRGALNATPEADGF
jgi:hypothetical protein